MCGLTGVFEYSRFKGTVDESTLVQMRDSMVHRGPDGAGNYISPDRRLGLAHRRLAIQDIAGGLQPMRGADGSWLVFNGEIYNYPSLRERLTAQGVVFSTRCDTEVILHLYARYGVDCVDHLTGMFAFALWDAGRSCVFFARDRLGEKPLYWTARNGRFIFGSEIKAILAHPDVTPEVERSQLGPYLSNLVTSSPNTLFAGIHKLPPGTRGICDQSGVRIETYWSAVEPRRVTGPGLADAAQTVRTMLERSVEARLLSDVPVGVLLSGGLDSTALVALLHEHARGLPTFSVGTADDPAIDERDEARWVAQHFGTDHHEIEVSERDALGFLPTLIHHQDEPLADPVCIPLHFVCQLARNAGVPVVLAGEGSDELFWGYPRYVRVMRHIRALRLLVRLPRQFAGIPLHASRVRNSGIYELLQGAAAGRLPPIHYPLGLNSGQRRSLLAEPSELPGWTVSGLADADVASQLMFDTQEYEFGMRLPELLLMRIDRFSMANSVEARVPFLDPDLVEYAYRLPLSHKLQGQLTKIVLREALKDIVPERILLRRKQGFGAPIARWFEGRLGPTLSHFIGQDALKAYFNTDVLTDLLARHRAGSPQTFTLWPILNFALWHKVWIEGEDLADQLESFQLNAA